MQTRRLAALAAIASFVALVLFSSAHIHGVSDPRGEHAFGDYFLEGQAHSGFLSATILLPVIALLVLHPPQTSRRPVVWSYRPCRYAPRAPPPLSKVLAVR